MPRASIEDKPIYLNNNYLCAYKRNNTGDYMCTKEEVDSMIRNKISTFDSDVLVNFCIDDLYSETINIYRTIFKALKGNHVWTSLSDLDFLEKIKATNVIDNIPYPTRAGLLFFGYDYKIMDLYPLYFLDYQEQLANISEIRYTFRIYSGTGEWSGNIFDFYYRVISRLEMDLPNPFELEEDNIHRKKETDLHAAIREAVTNTLVNADYSLPRGLVVKKSVNKITFENPGILRISKKQALKGGISDPRNSTFLHFFNQIGIGERAGSGIPTIINAFLKREYIEPIIKEEINPERTTLVLSFDKEKSNVTKGNNKKLNLSIQEIQILKYLEQNNQITRKEVEVLLDIKESRANSILKGMFNKKLLVKKGTTINSVYKLK